MTVKINGSHSACLGSSWGSMECLGLGLGLQGLYSATNCADNILGRFTIILQNQIARVDSFTNLTKRWVFRFRVNASIPSHNLISFGKQFHARGPYTANARLPKVSCLNYGTFRTRSSLDLMEFFFAFWWGDHFLDAGRCLAMKSFEDDQQCFEFNPVFDWKPVKRNECRSYAIIFPQIEN